MDNQKNNHCCEEFNPIPWDNKEFNWENKKFIKGSVFTLFFMPINFASVIIKMFNKVQSVNGQIQDSLCLSDHTSKWNMDLYLAVDKEIPGAKNITLSGKYISKVYEGDLKDTGKWCKDFEDYVKSKNMKVKKWYMWYTTCPKCAKKFGKNYVVIISEVE